MRLVTCMCCSEQKPLEPPIIDVGQEYVYCDYCYKKCSYVFINGDTIYYHEVRDIICTILMEIDEKNKSKKCKKCGGRI